MLRRRSALVLILVTLVAVIAAVMVVLEDRGRHRQAERSVLFPGVEREFNRISRIEIADKDGKVIIARTGDDRWILPEKHDYPADRVAVRRLILSFARMEVVEAKTRQPALYGRLGLRDLAAGDSRARQVTLWSGSTAVASLLIGERAASQAPGGGATAERAYVRRVGEAETWLAEGVPDVTAKVADWLDDRLFSLPRERIAEITVRHADGEELRLSRDAPQADFTLDEMPAGRSLKTYGGVDTTASVLAFLAFDDLRPAVEEDRTAATAVVTFRTFDGLEVILSIRDGWVHFGAAGDSPEAADISDRLSPWAYALPEYKMRDLAPRRDQLLAPESGEQDS